MNNESLMSQIAVATLAKLVFIADREKCISPV